MLAAGFAGVGEEFFVEFGAAIGERWVILRGDLKQLSGIHAVAPPIGA